MGAAFSKGLNSTSVSINIQSGRFGGLVAAIETDITTVTSPVNETNFTAAYGKIVNDLQSLGFSVDDSDSIAKAATFAAENAYSISGITTTLMKQIASAAGLARSFGILATPGCDTECACENETAMAAALAQVPSSSQVATAIQMWTDMLTVGTVL